MKSSQDKINGFLAHLEHVRKLSPYTLRSYRTDLFQFLTYLNDRELINLFPQSIIQKDVRKYFAYLRAEDYGPASVNRKLASLRTFYRWMLRLKEVDHNPTAGFASPRVERTSSPILTETQVQALLVAANCKSLWGQRDRAILELLYSTGIKIGTLVALNWENIDFHQQGIHLSGRSPRVLPLGLSTYQVLVEYWKIITSPGSRAKDLQAVFLNRSGRRLTARSIGRIVDKYAKKAGLPKWVSPQTLRHSMAVHMLDRGTNIGDIQAIMGHQSIETTRIYTKMREKAVLSPNSGS